MFGAFGQHITACSPPREIPIGDPLARWPIGGEPCDARGRLRQHGGLPGAGDDDEIARLFARDPRAEHREGGDGCDVGAVHGELGHEISRHRMPDECDGLAAGQASREFRHLFDFGRQRAGALLHVLHPAAHGAGVAAMAGEIEGDGGVAAMGEGHGHGLHELLRACEAMGDQGDGPVPWAYRAEN